MLDTRTLIFAVSITLITTLVTVIISGIINRNTPGVRQWMSAYALLVFGLLLQTGQGLVHPIVSVFIANIIIPSGFVMIWVGILNYKGKTTPRYPFILGAIVIFMIVMHSFVGLNEDAFGMRTIFISSICGLINILCAKVLLKTDKSSTAGERFTGLVFLAIGVALFIRAITAYTLADSLMLTSSNAFNDLSYTMAMVFSILLSFGLVIMPSERLQNRLSQLEDTDFLTGILSRKAFANYSNRAIGRSKDKQQSLSLLLFDIDDLKKINAQYGHSAGDAVLRDTCHKIKNMLRSSDLFGRISGEEFAIFLTDTSIETAQLIAERIRRLIEESTTRYEDNEIKYTISLGLMLINAQTESFEETYKEVDYYLYQAKYEGKNRVVCAPAT